MITQPDIICLQETKIGPFQIPVQLQQIPDYYTFYSHAEKKGYSGVAIYSKIKPKSVSTAFGIERFDCEGRILIAQYDAFTLLNIYFPNGKASKERLKYKLDFYDAFLEYIDGLRQKGHNLIICGDINTAHREIDLSHPKANQKTSGFLPEERAWIDKFLSHGYVDTFRHFHSEPNQYTWWDYKTKARERNIGWRLDYFYVNSEILSNVRDSFIMSEVMGSDHCPVALKIEGR